ncbi:Hypothetical predicted protein, partial [Pelobates cultripes]
MAAASIPHKPKRLPEMEDHSDIQQRIDAAFARFWYRLGQRLQAPMANKQPQPAASGLNRTHGVWRMAPPQGQPGRKTGSGNAGKRHPTPGTATTPKTTA